MDIDNIYLENLDEYINDENKIVTYKWLSQTLAIHVNQAKQMLYAFVQQQREQKKPLSITYSICGFIGEEKNKVLKVQIVREEQLKEAKSHMQPVSSCHIYSIQKSDLKDSNVLYMTDYDLLKENIFNSNNHSAIKCTAAKLRSEEEVARLKRKTQPTNVSSSSIKPVSKQNGTSKLDCTKSSAGIAGMFAASSTKPASGKTETSKSQVNGSNVKRDSSEQSTKQNGTSKTGSGKRSGGIAGMFAAGSSKAKVKDDTADAEKKQNKEIDIKQEPSDKKSSNKPKQGGVMSFLANQANKPKKKVEAVKTDASGDGDGIKETNKKTEEETRGKEKKETTRRKKTYDSDEGPSKKRRRIKAQAWSDSSSDEEMEIENPLPSPPPSPPPCPPQREPSPPVNLSPSDDTSEQEDSGKQMESLDRKTEAGTEDVSYRKKTRKLVSKTSMNDEGFVVTEKVWEVASDSEPEIVEPAKPSAKSVKKQPAKAPPSKKQHSPSKTGTKQTSMMNFFKKK